MDKEQQIAAFWSWFTANAESIRRQVSSPGHAKFQEDISERLDAIDDRLAWEIGPGADGALLLTISSAGNPQVEATAEVMHAASPTIRNWQFARYIPPKNIPAIEAILRSQGYQVDLSNVRVCPRISEDKTRVDVDLIIPPSPEARTEHENYLLAFQILDGVLGEQAVEEWIAAVHIKHRPTSKTIALSRFNAFMAELFEAGA